TRSARPSQSSRSSHRRRKRSKQGLFLAVAVARAGIDVGNPGLADLLRPVLVARPGVQVAADRGMAAAAALHAGSPLGVQLGGAERRTLTRGGQILALRFTVRHNAFRRSSTDWRAG